MKRSGFEFQITTRSLSQQWVKIMRSSCKNVSDFGLMYYGARWYDPAISHFAQADTIVPGAGNSQAWDRYAYVNNSPVRYSDPSGHRPIEEQGGKKGCKDPVYCRHNQPKPIEELQEIHHPSICTLPPPWSTVDYLMEYLRFNGQLFELWLTIEKASVLDLPLYKQAKHLTSLGPSEYILDAALQFYDDRNLELNAYQRAARVAIRGIESVLIDGASQGAGLAVAASVQVALVEVPIIPAGVGYAVGSYSTSVILTNAANQYNPIIFAHWGLGGN